LSTGKGHSLLPSSGWCRRPSSKETLSAEALISQTATAIEIWNTELRKARMSAAASRALPSTKVAGSSIGLALEQKRTPTVKDACAPLPVPSVSVKSTDLQEPEEMVRGSGQETDCETASLNAPDEIICSSTANNSVEFAAKTKHRYKHPTLSSNTAVDGAGTVPNDTNPRTSLSTDFPLELDDPFSCSRDTLRDPIERDGEIRRFRNEVNRASLELSGESDAPSSTSENRRYQERRARLDNILRELDQSLRMQDGMDQ
jgi:hypothetical protein